jgi:hypothetical protein
MGYIPASNVATGWQTQDYFNSSNIGATPAATINPNTGGPPPGILLVGPTRNVSGTWSATQVRQDPNNVQSEPPGFTVDYLDPILGWVDSGMAKVLVPATGNGSGTFSTPQLPAQALGSRLHPHLQGMALSVAGSGTLSPQLVVTCVSS